MADSILLIMFMLCVNQMFHSLFYWVSTADVMVSDREWIMWDQYHRYTISIFVVFWKLKK